uniref:Dynein light chain n=1 Tax=Moschus moschiferus TaxID=68415 RepID=A0A8C6FJF3_MOSMO
MLLTRFEQENGHLVQVEVDEVFGFMCHVTTEVPPHSAVPGGVELLVKLLLDMGHNVLLYIIFLQCLSSKLHQVLLHLLRHISVLDHGLSVTHSYQGSGAGRLQQSPGGRASKAHNCVERQLLPKLWCIYKKFYVSFMVIAKRNTCGRKAKKEINQSLLLKMAPHSQYSCLESSTDGGT